MKFIFFIIFLTMNLNAQYQEASITRTTTTNSVFPRQFPSMTIRKMNEKEYWIFESLGTNTIFHRQFPTYIVRKETYGESHLNQKWGVYRTTSSNSVFPRQFPDRYISELQPKEEEQKNIYRSNDHILPTSSNIKPIENAISSYTYSKSLRSDGKRAYNPEQSE